VKKLKKTHSQLVEGTSILDIGEGSLKFFELDIKPGLCFLSLGDLDNLNVSI